MLVDDEMGSDDFKAVHSLNMVTTSLANFGLSFLQLVIIMNFEKLEYRSAIKFLNKKGLTSDKIRNEMIEEPLPLYHAEIIFQMQKVIFPKAENFGRPHNDSLMHSYCIDSSSLSDDSFCPAFAIFLAVDLLALKIDTMFTILLIFIKKG
uniref:Uncharacterized protein n=1 Tax=Romanomermis culicivorax TaxID=13658 RepID=A0A915KXD0_ROMCU